MRTDKSAVDQVHARAGRAERSSKSSKAWQRVAQPSKRSTGSGLISPRRSVEAFWLSCHPEPRTSELASWRARTACELPPWNAA